MEKYRGSIAETMKVAGYEGEESADIVLSTLLVFSPAVEMFLKSAHILYMDACFTKERWRILVVCFMDANHHIQPLAFSFGSSENWVNWTTLLQRVKQCGVDSVADLVIVSDGGTAIESAIASVFPDCEHVRCFAHAERNIQAEWIKQYGNLEEQDVEGIDAINRFIECLNQACIAVDEAECEMWLESMERVEMNYNKCREEVHPVSDYVRKQEGLVMWKWRFPHYMVRTSNPVESCMAYLCKDLDGEGGVRDIGLLSRYRVMIAWLLNWTRRRRTLLKNGKEVLPVRKHGRVYCSWVIKEMISRGHHVEQYESMMIVKPSHKEMDPYTEEWDRRTIAEGDEGGKYYYRVYHLGYGKIYKVNLSKRDNPCSCHEPYWKRIPCIHVIRVLHHLKQYWTVWEYVSSIYTVSEIEKGCWELNVDDNEFIGSLWDKSPGDEMEKKAILAFSNKKGKKRGRLPSKGECKKEKKSPPKREWSNLLVSCNKGYDASF